MIPPGQNGSEVLYEGVPFPPELVGAGEMAKTQAGLDKHDREIATIRTLLKQGMRLVVDLGAAQKRTERNLQALERDLQALIDTMRRGGDGHSKTSKLNLR